MLLLISLAAEHDTRARHAWVACQGSSPHSFQDLAVRTRADYQRCLYYLKTIGDTPLVRFDRGLVVRIRDKTATKHGRRFGNYVGGCRTGPYAPSNCVYDVYRARTEGRTPAAKIFLSRAKFATHRSGEKSKGNCSDFRAPHLMADGHPRQSGKDRKGRNEENACHGLLRLDRVGGRWPFQRIGLGGTWDR
jgi:hypothetical protein